MTKLNPEPRQVPLTNPTVVAALAVSDGIRTLARRGDTVALAGNSDQRLTVLDLATGARSTPVETEVTWAQIRGDLLAVGGPETEVRDLATGDLRWRQDPPAPTHPSQPSRRPLVALHPDGVRFAVGGSGDTTVRVHSLAEQGAEGTVLHDAPKRLRWLEYSPDGSYLIGLDASGNSTTVWREGESSPHLPDVFGENLSDIMSVAFHPGGEHIAVGMFSGGIKVHRLPDGARVDRRLRFHSGRLLAMAFTPDGAHLLSGDDDGKLLFWVVE